MKNISNVQPAPGSSILEGGNRTTVVDRSETLSSGKTIRELVDIMAAEGREFFHPENEEGQATSDLQADVNILRENTRRRPQPPTSMELFGAPDAKRPSDFMEPQYYDKSVLNSYQYHGKEYEFGAAANGIVTRCQNNERIDPARIACYRDYFEYIIKTLDVLESAGDAHNGRMDKYTDDKIKLAAAQNLLEKQMEVDFAITSADVVARDKSAADSVRVHQLEKELAAMKSGQEGAIVKAVAMAMQAFGKKSASED